MPNSEIRNRNENAVMTIRSCQKADGETDASELNTTARYRFHDHTAEIIYTELDEMGNPNGETTITVLHDGLVTIRKTGFTEAIMVLEVGKTHPARYHTVVGAMEMRLCATEISVDLGTEGGSLKLRYLLDIGDTYSAVNLIDLQVRLRTEA